VRSGIAVALALSLPEGAQRETVVMLTYSVVLFSVFAQGLTVGVVARKIVTSDAAGTRS
jgi:CPA1 family monovalent cation:H+ antiporter